LVDLQQRA